MAAKDYPKRGDAANLIMKAVRNLSSAPAQVAIVRRFVDQSLMARNQLVKLLEEQGQQGAAFLELLIGGGELIGDFDEAKELADRIGDRQGADALRC